MNEREECQGEHDADDDDETHLKIPPFTTARTAAFIPALSPPLVNTAIFIFPRVFQVASSSSPSLGRIFRKFRDFDWGLVFVINDAEGARFIVRGGLRIT